MWQFTWFASQELKHQKLYNFKFYYSEYPKYLQYRHFSLPATYFSSALGSTQQLHRNSQGPCRCGMRPGHLWQCECFTFMISRRKEMVSSLIHQQLFLTAASNCFAHSSRTRTAEHRWNDPDIWSQSQSARQGENYCCHTWVWMVYFNIVIHLWSNN